MTPACAICGNRDGNRSHLAREMMVGLRDTFSYLECAACGCLQNLEVPADLGRYYGAGYYSMTAQRPAGGAVQQALKAIRTRAFLQGGGVLGQFLLRRFGPPDLPDWVRRAGLRQDSSILELGCGSGAQLLTMRSEGFTRLAGADPFIDHDIDHGRGLKISKRRIEDIAGRYDAVVMEHAFEHVPSPQDTLRQLVALLAPGGTLVISMPLVSEAWKRYGVDWVQLDAPRHLHLFTERGFRLLAGGLQMLDVDYDSTGVQFWASEQYRRDIPLLDPRSPRVNAASPLFSAEELARFEAEAQALNLIGQGDQATFCLRKAG